MRRLILPDHIDVLITSAGGVGTTMLLEHVGKYQVTNQVNDSDCLKHLPIPPIPSSHDQKFVYVFGDPILAVVSLFRRKYHHVQCQKLRRYERTESYVSPSMSLDEFASANVDRFRLREHFNHWHDQFLDHPTLFIRYETLQEFAKALGGYLGLCDDFVANFPPRQPRRSTLKALAPQTLSNLHRIYGDFQSELDALPNAFVRYPSH